MNDYVAQVPQLPQDAVLLHIGPYKTGTTAVQAALAERRTELAAGGVLYPGRGRNHHRVAWALRGRGTTGMEAVPYREWEVMAEAVGEHPGRVVISSEFFTSITDAQIAEVVGAIGPDRLHVVTTIRSLERLLPSDWQERVKTHGFTGTYESWLREVLDPNGSGWSGRLFWRLYGVSRLVGRWLKVLPSDHVIAIVADERARDQTFRTFECLLGLPGGMLTPPAADASNTSLSTDRIELIRRVNELFEQRQWGERNLRRYVHLGMLQELRKPLPGDDGPAKPALPQWAVDRVITLSRERANGVQKSGAVVVGRPEDLLYQPPRPAAARISEPSTISVAAATQAVAGVLEAALAREDALIRRVAERDARCAFDGQSTRALAGELSRRLRRRAGRLVRR